MSRTADAPLSTPVEAPKTVLRSQPWWQGVTTLDGVGPTTSDQFLGAPSAIVAPLEVTTGSLNFKLPSDVDPTQYRSAVIWCRLIDSAYSAATLRPAP